jgi:hypothetical protein
MASSVSDPRQQAEMMQQQIYELLTEIVKGSPAVSLGLRVGSPDGEAVGAAKFQLSPELANDPLLKAGNQDRRATMAAVWSKYGGATANFEAPVSAITHLAKPDQLKQLEQNGILVRSGANYICRASFKDGAWFVNGRKIQMPASPPCAKPCTNRS